MKKLHLVEVACNERYFLDELVNGEVMCTVTKIGHEDDGNADRRISTLRGGDGGSVLREQER